MTKRIAILSLFTVLLFSCLAYFLFNPSGLFNKQKHNTSSLVDNKINQESCTRIKPFSLNLEFDSALDLIQDRSKNAESVYISDQNAKSSPANIPRYFPALDARNCLNILYSDNIPNIKDTGAWFDSENSTPNNLIIKINPQYQNQNLDNLVMAMLLAHELAHVQQYGEIRSGTKMTCVDQEVDAFIRQLKFLAILNKDEQPKITNLIKTKYYYVLGTFYDLWIEQDKAATTCNALQVTNQFNQESFNDCFWTKMETISGGFIENIPGYQKHCKLE